MLQEKQFKRDVAQKTGIIGILGGNFDIAEDGTAVLNANGRLVKRVSIIATIVVINDLAEGRKDAVVDDGTGQIRLRFFDNDALLEGQGVGDFVAIIGKPRRYGGETYVVPEIMKTVSDVKWAEVRRVELQVNAVRAAANQAGNEKPAKAATGKNEGALQDTSLDGIDTVSKGKIEIYRIIKELDTGRGADISAVASKFTEKFSGGNAELLIREMTKAGDLFEVLPGRLKALE